MRGRLLELSPCITNCSISPFSLADLALIPLHKSLDPSANIKQLVCECVRSCELAIWTNGADNMKARTGSIVKRKPRSKGAKATWWARVTYIDPKTGKRHDLQRRGQNKAHARDLLQALLREIDVTEGQGPLNERKTFAELCDYFEKHYVKPAEYVDGRKIAGVRSLGTAKGQLSVLREYFGSSRLRSITHGDVRQFRAARLAQQTRTKTQRTIASVNRELSMLRRMLNVAQREGWILRNPFSAGDSLISLADENKRERILTRDEELKLLGACETPQRLHLKSILICALDTGMRQGEIFSLRWRDVDLEDRLLNIQAFSHKDNERAAGRHNHTTCNSTRTIASRRTCRS